MATNKTIYQLRVPSNTTDIELIDKLKNVLPELLVKKMNVSPDIARAVAPEMASRIVNKARQCDQAHYVNDVYYKIQQYTPTKEECDDFKKAVDEIIEIIYVEKKRSGHMTTTKYVCGKLWYYLRERLLGLPPENLDEGANAAIGTRG